MSAGGGVGWLGCDLFMADILNLVGPVIKQNEFYFLECPKCLTLSKSINRPKCTKLVHQFTDLIAKRILFDKNCSFKNLRV